ncbi:MAG: response regulator [Burkholderiales bacterium]|nr:response regulator [Burkholderiales bacterium]
MTPTVFVVDDDAGVRDALAQMISAAGLSVRTFASGKAFLQAFAPDWRGCILLDVAMPGMSGPELHDALVARGASLPIVYLTAHGEVPTAVRAMKAGAAEFLEKPVAGPVLLDAVRRALAIDAERQADATAHAQLRDRFSGLTRREREVMALAARGRSNKEIARELGISHRTVEIHRGRVMLKLGLASAFELAAAAAVCGPGTGRDPAPRRPKRR